MWRVILFSVIIVAIALFLMCITIIFKKDGKFPDGEVGHNKALRKRGIVCSREEDEKIWGKSSYIKVSGRKRIKFEPDDKCMSCDAACEIRNLVKH